MGVPLVPHDVEPDALEAALAGLEVSVERARHAFGTGEVGPADDAGGHARAAAGRVGRAGAQDELGLADRAERLVAVGPERRHALDEHGGLDVVSTAEIGVKGRRVVGDAVPRRPQVVMRVDDGQLRVEDVFSRRVLLVDLGEVHESTLSTRRLAGQPRERGLSPTPNCRQTHASNPDWRKGTP